MAYLDSAYGDYKSLKRDARKMASTGETSSTGSGGGLETADYVGLGLQLIGGLMQDNKNEKFYEQEKRDQRAREDELMRRQDMKDARQREIDARNFTDKMNLEKRGLNLQGLQALTGLTANAQTMGRRMSFRDALLNYGGGAK